MFSKKSKVIKQVIVKFDDHLATRFEKIIEVPSGWKFRVGFAEQARLIDETKTIRQAFDWRAGFTIEYEFIYE